MSPTQELAKWICKVQWSDIPAATSIKTKHCVLEFLSCCLVARNEEPARLLLAVMEQLGSSGQASVIGHPVKLSVERTALVNGALGHIWEIDDTHRHTMSHPGDSVIPAALAVAEWLGCNGQQVLTAIVAGYEVAIRICHAVSPSHLEKGWHPTGTTNTFGTAAAVGKLLGLDNRQMAWALGLSATQAAGTFCHIPERAMSKDLNPGKAAASGILAALLARQGFTGSPTALENGKGFVHTHADESDLTRITAGLGNSYRIDEIAFKPWACCRHNHAAIEALLRLCKAHAPAADTIGEIEVSLYPAAIWLVDDPDPFDKGFYGTRYSVQFNLALAFVTGEAGMERALIDQPYVESMLKEARVQEVMKKVRVKIDPELAKDWPNKWPARVNIILSDGQSLQQTIEYPLGEPEHPMAYAKLIDKFKRASQGYLSEAEAQTVAQMVESFERENDMKAFFRAVSGMHGAGEKA